jgi:hypothetical protein
MTNPPPQIYSYFSNRSLTSLEQFPARFYWQFTTYYSERSQTTMESHRIGLHFVFPYVGLTFYVTKHAQHAPALAIIITTEGKRGLERLHLAHG